MKKYIIIVLILNFSLISCSKVEILSDPYWNTLISDFKGKAAGIKFQALVNRKILKLSVVNVEEDISDLGKFSDSLSDIYLISPLLSQSISTPGEADSSAVFYYFGHSNKDAILDSDNMVIIERDRNKAFFDAGVLVSKEFMDISILSIVYDVENSVQNVEVMSFLDGIKQSGNKISISSLKVKSDTSESGIRGFFDKKNVKNNSLIVIFTDKWRKICYELSERDDKMIITCDSWFYKTYESSIVISIEDDIKGMLKKVYNNVNTGKHADITLDGIISR